MTFFLTAEQAITGVIRLLSIYLIIDSAEKLSVSHEFGKNGLFYWPGIRQHGYFKNKPGGFIKVADLIFNFNCWIIIMAMRGCAGLLLVLTPGNTVLVKIMLLIVFTTGSLINLRNTPFGAETDNRFALMIAGALTLRCFVPTQLVTQVCLWFIALQSCISYVTAGVAKLFKSEWRNGRGIYNVFQSPGLVQAPNITHWLRRHRTFAKCLTWGMLSMECMFPLALTGPPLLWLFLVWGVIFHASIAIFIRLGKFFWVWIATYPAIIFVAH